jgi:hypothetical protein
MRYLERRPVRTKLQRKVVTAVNIAPETITADEVNFGTAVITTETDLGNVVVDNPKDGLLVVSSTNGSSSVYSGSDSAFIPITDTAAQVSADSAAADAAQAASDAALADAAAQQALDDAAAATAEAVAAQETADAAAAEAQLAFEQAEAAALAAAGAEQDAIDSAAAALAAETAAREAFDEATAAATAASDAETAALASADGAADALAQAQEAAAQAQEAADQATASAEAAEDADAAAASAAAESAAAEAAAAAAAESADLAALEAADATLAAESSADDAAAAASSALAATESANKKNSVFRAPASAYAPASAPTANSIGDIWFDTTPLTADVTQAGTAAGGAKPKRWNGTIWEPFGLSYAAITSLDADTITAGTLTGRTVRTSASGNRVEMSNTDVISFYNNDGITVGTIQPGLLNEGLVLTAGSGGSSIRMTGSGWADDSAMILSTSQGSGNITMFDDTYDGESGGGMLITGNSLVIQGTNGWDIRDSASSAVIYGQGGDLSLQGGGAGVDLANGEVYIAGDLVLSFGTYVQGTGAPTVAATDGTIIFKYT